MNHHLFSLLLLHIRNITVFCNAYLPTLATAYFIFADFITFGLQYKRIEMSRKLYEAMKQENFNVHYITETGGHDWTYWDACIQNTIQILNDKVPVSPDWRSICR